MDLYINASPLLFPNWSGVQFYIYRILSAMIEQGPEHRFHLHFSQEGEDARVDALLCLPNVTGHRHPGPWRSYAALPLEILRTRSRAYYLMNGDGRLRIPVPCPTAAIVYDCGNYILPSSQGADTAELRETAGRNMRKRDILFTLSETVKAEMVDLFSVRPEQVVVAPCAVDRPDMTVQGERPKALAAGRPFFLMVNMGRAYKNWQDVVAAFALYLEAHPHDKETVLVLAGELRGETEKIAAALAVSPVQERILSLGYLSEAELHYLYCHARMALFPSRYEGFGIPALEAMAYDLPIIVSDIPVLKEVTADAALHVPLDRPEVLAEAMDCLNSDSALRASLVQRGQARLEAYSWRDSGRKTLDALTALGNR